MADDPTPTPQDPTPSDPPQDPQPDDPKPQEGDKTFDAEYVKKLRDEAARYRTSAKDAEKRLAELEQSLGRAASEKERAEAELQAARLERAVSKAARKLDADDELTYAYLQSAGKLNGLDPTKGEDIEKAIQEAIEAKPSLKVAKPQKIGDNTVPERRDTASVNSWIRRAAGRA